MSISPSSACPVQRQFYAAFKKYADRVNAEYAAEICRNHSYIFYGVSLVQSVMARYKSSFLLLP